MLKGSFLLQAVNIGKYMIRVCLEKCQKQYLHSLKSNPDRYLNGLKQEPTGLAYLGFRLKL